MRVFIDTDLKSPSTGKGYFAQRLSIALRSIGVEIVPCKSKHDIALHILKVRKETKSIRVMRLNGVYHNTKQKFKKMNKAIASERNKCNAIVYQSNFAKSMNEKYLPRTKVPNTVILNGANVGFYDKITPISKEYEYNFISSSRWRPHKRLQDTIDSFLLSDIESSCLHIVGSLDKSGVSKNVIRRYMSIRNIKFYNKVSQKKIASILNICNGCIHLCMTDCCPNSVVESVCAGIPVICSNEGGTREVANKPPNIILNIDKKYNLKPIDLYSPPKINTNLVADAIVKLCQKTNDRTNSSHVNINNTASQYLKFFESLL
jgi:glycosyltransferase involved in cell wall biosynthesis